MNLSSQYLPALQGPVSNIPLSPENKDALLQEFANWNKNYTAFATPSQDTEGGGRTRQNQQLQQINASPQAQRAAQVYKYGLQQGWLTPKKSSWMDFVSDKVIPGVVQGATYAGIGAGLGGIAGVGPAAGGGGMGTGAAANTGAYADMAAQAAGGIMPGAAEAAGGATGGILAEAAPAAGGIATGGATGAASLAAPAAAATAAKTTVPGWGLAIGGIGQAIGGLAAAGALGDHGASDANSAAQDAARASAAASRTQAQIAQDQWDNYKKTFQPLEQDLAAKAKNYGTPEEQEAAAGRANADVTKSFDAQRRAQELGLSGSRKLNPNDPAYAATVGSTNLSEAATRAGAETQARIQARDTGFARELDAIGIGKGIPASSANTFGNIAATTGIRGQPAFNQAQTLNAQQAQGVYGLTNLAQRGFNTWAGNNNSNSDVSAPSGWTPEQTAAYDGSGVTGDQTLYLQKGGIVRGRGTETSDSNPAMLSRNEAVLNAGAVRIIGRKAIDKLNAMGKLARDSGIKRRAPPSLPAKLMHMQGA